MSMKTTAIDEETARLDIGDEDGPTDVIIISFQIAAMRLGWTPDDWNIFLESAAQAERELRTGNDVKLEWKE